MIPLASDQWTVFFLGSALYTATETQTGQFWDYIYIYIFFNPQTHPELSLGGSRKGIFRAFFPNSKDIYLYIGLVQEKIGDGFRGIFGSFQLPLQIPYQNLPTIISCYWC